MDHKKIESALSDPLRITTVKRPVLTLAKDNLLRENQFAWQALGKVNYALTEKEKKSRQFRRSLYITEDMRAGDIISEKNIRAIRPGLGLPPKYYDKLLGKKVTGDVRRGTPVSWSLIGK